MGRLKTHISGLFSVTVILSMLFLSSCGSEEEITEGEIEFEITYPYYQGSGFMASMLPDKMIMTFKDGVYKTEVAKGTLFKSAFIVDCNNNTVINLFHFGTKNIFCRMGEKDVKKILAKEPKPQYLETNDGDSLAGFLCTKTVAYYEEVEQPDVAVYTTSDIKIPNSNWWTPFNQLEDVMLEYEIERFDFRMRFTAVKFTKREVSEDEFKVPSQYKKVSIKKIEKELNDVFGTLTK